MNFLGNAIDKLKTYAYIESGFQNESENFMTKFDEYFDRFQRDKEIGLKTFSLIFFSPTKMVLSGVLALISLIVFILIVTITPKNILTLVTFFSFFGIVFINLFVLSKINLWYKDSDILEKININEIVKFIPIIKFLLLGFLFSVFGASHIRSAELLIFSLFFCFASIFHILGKFSETLYKEFSIIFLFLSLISVLTYKLFYPWSIFIILIILLLSNFILAINMKRKFKNG